MSRASITDQTLALAGIAQAATLASQLARDGLSLIHISEPTRPY